ncbi:MAG: putative Na+/H+ antiporter [Verrucomicrobia bacterium]|nr:putative Na+/H+ antiporter [Verrucomicrobiota bacterium]
MDPGRERGKTTAGVDLGAQRRSVNAIVVRPLPFLSALLIPGIAQVSAAPAVSSLPRPLDSYGDPAGADLWTLLVHRAQAEPFNAVALAIFAGAILHTFFTAKIRHWAHVVEERHAAARRTQRPREDHDADGQPDEVSFAGQILHFLGEVEAVFGLWVLVLAAAITWFKGWPEVIGYVSGKVSYVEPVFVVVIMALAATRPVLDLAERCLRAVAALGHGTPAAWWLSILILAPLLGSFITEPAAMTIGALLLGRQFYALHPSPRLAYATLGLLFVNISVGGTLTHFAAPPVIMVAGPWKWDLWFMFSHFGVRAIIGVVLSTVLYYLVFRRELGALRAPTTPPEEGAATRPPVPGWITGVHLAFLAFTVWHAHYPVMCVGALLFFLAFVQATAHHQTPVDLRPPVLVGFFLAGLVVHGGLQSWWIEPVLTRLGEMPLFFGAVTLTAFNDNAAITYLASLVPGFTDELKFVVVAGAVTGGGLTVIANAPNPAGQAILSRYFPGGISPLALALAALAPTAIMSACFLIGR